MAAEADKVEPVDSEQDEEEDVYEVERIIDMRVEEGEVLYRVRWKNYCSDDDTWEPEAHLEDCCEVLLAFKKSMAELKAKKEAEAKKSVKPPPTKSDTVDADSESEGDKDRPTESPVKKKKKKKSREGEEEPPPKEKKKKKKDKRKEEFRPLPAPETDEEEEEEEERAPTPTSPPKEKKSDSKKRQIDSEEEDEEPVPSKKHKKEKGKEGGKYKKDKAEEGRKRKGKKERKIESSEDEAAPPLDDTLSDVPSESQMDDSASTETAAKSGEKSRLEDKSKQKKGKWEVKLQGIKDLIQDKKSKKPDATQKESNLQKLKSLTSKVKEDAAPHSDSSDSSTLHKKAKSKGPESAATSAAPPPKVPSSSTSSTSSTSSVTATGSTTKPKEEEVVAAAAKEEALGPREASGSTNLFEKFLLNCEAKDRAPRRQPAHQAVPEKISSKPTKLTGKIEKFSKTTKESPAQKPEPEKTEKNKQSDASRPGQSYGFSLDSEEREAEPKPGEDSRERKERPEETQRTGWERKSSTEERRKRREDSEPRLFMACDDNQDTQDPPGGADKCDKGQATLSLGMDLNLDWMTLDDFQKHLNGEDEILSGPPLSPNEVLKLLEEDPGSLVRPRDSSSDDEDIVHPDNTQDSSDSDYCLPSSESDEDYEPPLARVPGPSRPPQPAASPPPTALHTQSLTPPPTTRQKRGRSSVGASAPATKRGKSRLASPESEEGDRWHDREEECIKPDPLRFKPARTPGPTFNTTRAWSPISLFQLFFSASVVRKIIDNTNANAAKRKQAGLKWEVLTVKDFYIFLSIIIFTGLVTVHNRSDYWRKKCPYNFQFPGDSMTRNRFESILWSLHLSDPEEDEENDKKRNTAEYDRLFKIKPLYTDMVTACKAHFQPHQNVSIDERMVKSKARISMKQYMKDKPTKWGYKLFVLADSSIGYTWNFFVYAGKSESTTGRGLSYSAVMDLLPFPLLGSGYLLYTDNFYTSPALFTDLSKKNIGCCGTIRKHVTGFPQTQTNNLPRKAERGDMRWIRSGNLLFVKWMDMREVAMCSTVHQAYSGQTVRRKVKEAGVWQKKSIPVPDSIVDYNHSMGGVDLFDALIGSYSVRHKTMKWYKTFFYHFVDIAAVNSYLLHKELFKLRQDPTQTKPFTHKTFREQLAKEMLEFAEGSAATPPPPRPPPPSTTCMPMVFDCEESRIRRLCKRCRDAGRPKMKTAVYCRRCKVPLCLTSKKNCFQLWHDAQ
ncbi:M-phase phosphoprotein 8 isoform X2 [Anarrhichthys ocellatus]|uniref:M-phase phosphoprotein 8 isoform X2 n=1 Tax=Anarrhichthys ocellatus TaxID=433405 RepID=UPI0012ED98E8|nr:M-phase phosphoprotein 8 isoform X2 [Anarrhichthys ocellatus]